MSSHRIAAAVVATLLTVLAAGGPTFADDLRTISVTGEGTASAAPDMAVLTAGVVTQGATAGEALDANSKATADVMKLFSSEQIEARDIQTSNFNLQPLYVYPKDGDQSPPRITGYAVTNNVTVRVRNLANLGPLLDKAVGAGANAVNGIEFVVSKQSELLDDARKAAVADARRKAELYAAAAGVKLGALVGLTESQAAGPGPQPMLRVQADAGAVPIAAGESQLQVTVTASFKVE